MRRLPIAAMVAAVAVAASASPAAAQRIAASPTYASAPSAKRDSAAAKAQELSARADQRWHTYDLAGAKRDFQSAVEILRARQLYAGPTLVSLAHVTFATESPVRAAKVLVEAAEEAASYGDLALQASALFEASLLFEQAGDHGQAQRLLESTRRLLNSPYLPVEVKSSIERRIVAGE